MAKERSHKQQLTNGSGQKTCGNVRTRAINKAILCIRWINNSEGFAAQRKFNRRTFAWPVFRFRTIPWGHFRPFFKLGSDPFAAREPHPWLVSLILWSFGDLMVCWTQQNPFPNKLIAIRPMVRWLKRLPSEFEPWEDERRAKKINSSQIPKIVKTVSTITVLSPLWETHGVKADKNIQPLPPFGDLSYSCCHLLLRCSVAIVQL